MIEFSPLEQELVVEALRYAADRDQKVFDQMSAEAEASNLTTQAKAELWDFHHRAKVTAALADRIEKPTEIFDPHAWPKDLPEEYDPLAFADPNELLQHPSPDLPKYRKVAHYVKNTILAGEYLPGEAIPSEAALMQEHEVSKGTVRKALRVLKDEGLIETGRGKLTTVKKQPKKRGRK